MRQNHCLYFSRWLTKLSAVLSIIFALQACSIFDAPIKYVSSQPGEQLQDHTKLYSLTSEESISAFIQGYEFKSDELKKLATANKLALSRFIINANQFGNRVKAINETVKANPDKAEVIVHLILKLYPIDQYRIFEELIETSEIAELDINNGALLAGLDPNDLFDVSAAKDMAYRIEPLIHSASITLFNQTDDIQNQLLFKEVTQSNWNKGLALQWEPIRGALSGSIVRLKAETQYQIKLTLTNQYGEEEIQEHQFSTRPNSPPIDPNKIYKLSDIYSGGQLNLEALNIEGTPDGWAKIIGDDNTIIQAYEEDMSAIHIGSQNYIMLENIKLKGGWRYGIHSFKAHHIWIKGCDVSEWGRVATEYRNGKGYYQPDSTVPINYDAGIYLERSGVVVIEECEIHSPNGQANHWGNGHPNGPNALQVVAHHPTEAFRGQHIVRNNRFYGTPEKRFNDVIEGRYNFKTYGGFGRDSAIYGNYLAYANDDLIEIDGGQSNVLVYDNELTQGYCGISTAPNRIGPSYLFNNYIHDLGDERGKEWGAIKMGGLMSAPAGLTNVFENIIVTNRNGIVSANVRDDATYWVNAINNIIITRLYGTKVGYGVYDSQRYNESNFQNNLIHNLRLGEPLVDTIERNFTLHPDSFDTVKTSEFSTFGKSIGLKIDSDYTINNFSTHQSNSQNELKTNLIFKPENITSFSNQDKHGEFVVDGTGNSLTLTGNTWKKIPFDYSIEDDTILEVDVSANGPSEIIGLALETNNKLSQFRAFQFTGSQAWGQQRFSAPELSDSKRLTIPVGQFILGPIDRLVFFLDNDAGNKNDPTEAVFTNIQLYEGNELISQNVFDPNQFKTNLIFEAENLTSFSNQDKYGEFVVDGTGNTLNLTGNTWKKIPFDYLVKDNTILEVTVSADGPSEIIGIAVETDNKLSQLRTFKFTGSQEWGQQRFSDPDLSNSKTFTIPVGQFVSGQIDRLVFFLDNDAGDRNDPSEAVFTNIQLYEGNDASNSSANTFEGKVVIGIVPE